MKLCYNVLGYNQHMHIMYTCLCSQLFSIVNCMDMAYLIKLLSAHSILIFWSPIHKTAFLYYIILQNAHTLTHRQTTDDIFIELQVARAEHQSGKLKCYSPSRLWYYGDRWCGRTWLIYELNAARGLVVAQRLK